MKRLAASAPTLPATPRGLGAAQRRPRVFSIALLGVEPAPHFMLIGFGVMPVNGLTMNKDSLERLPSTDRYATPANVHDSVVYHGRLDRQRQRFEFDVRAVGLNAGYATAGIAHRLDERGILGVTGNRNQTPPRPGMMRK
jgi:hypothetical protein